MPLTEPQPSENDGACAAHPDVTVAGSDDLTRSPFIVSAAATGITPRCEAEATVSRGITVVVADRLFVQWPRRTEVCPNPLESDQSRTAESASSSRPPTTDAIKSGKYGLICVTPKRVVTAGFAKLFTDTHVAKTIIDEAVIACPRGCDRPNHNRLISELAALFPGAGPSIFPAIGRGRTYADPSTRVHVGNRFILVADVVRSYRRYSVEQRSDAPLAQLLVWLYSRRASRGVIYCIDAAEAGTLTRNLQRLGFRATCNQRHFDDPCQMAGTSDLERRSLGLLVLPMGDGQKILWSDIDFVFHTIMPPSLGLYLQDVRAADRNGRGSDCAIFYGAEDIETWSARLGHTGSPSSQQEGELNRMQAYCLTSLCRHLNILTYLKASYVPPPAGAFSCCRCDNCLGLVRACFGDDVRQV